MSGFWRRARASARPNRTRSEERSGRRSGRRRRGGRWARILGWSAASGLLAAGLIVGYRELQPLLEAWLEIREVALVGAHRVTRREVLDRLGLAPGTTLLSVDVPRLSGRLRGHAWVKEVDVVRRPPHTLEVRVVERRPAAWARSPTLALLIDAEGHVLGVSQAPEDGRLPIVSGLDLNALMQGGTGARLTAARSVQLATVLTTALGEAAAEGEVEVDAGNSENLVAVVGGLRFQFGASGFEEKWQRYRRLEAELHARADDDGEWRASAGRREIDLRYPDKVIVRERG